LPPKPDAQSFEEALSALQEVVRQLESGSVSLEAALELSARGAELASQCERLLEAAELRVTRLPAESASPLSDAPAEP
jgi:exodeoxyribonuclease VII small subunit